MRRSLALLLPLMMGLSPEVVEWPKGGDLAQFDLVGLPLESVAIVDGEVRLSGKPLGYVATRREFRDYDLTFEFRYDRPEGLKSDADFRGNSGVLLHLAGPRKVWPSCVQVQLAQSDPGAIFAMNDSTCDAASDPVAQKSAIKPVGEWNAMKVRCRGGAITAHLNGVEVARGEKAEPDHGPIAWQSEGKPVRFRKIRVESLPSIDKASGLKM